MAEHNKPLISSTYTNFITELDTRFDDIATWISSARNEIVKYLPQNAIRWNHTSYRWEINTANDGAEFPQWSVFSNRYDININGTVGATSPNTGNFTTLQSTGATILPASTTIGGGIPVTTTAAQSLENKSLVAPYITTILNGAATISIPTNTTTLVGRNTIDTLTNKTLTSPKIDVIVDSSNLNIVTFTAINSAVNNIDISNAISTNSPSISAIGTDTNININLVTKGSGNLLLNNNSIVTSTGSWSGNTIAFNYGGTGNNTAFNTGGVTYASSTNVLSTTAAGSAGQVLQSNGTSAPIWVSTSSITVGNATTATTATTVTNGVYTIGDQSISGVKSFSTIALTGKYIETVFALSGTAPQINPSNGTIQTWTLSGNSSPTININSGESLLLMIDDGAAYTITWPNITWKSNNGVAPILDLTGYTIIGLWKVASTIYGARIGG